MLFRHPDVVHVATWTVQAMQTERRPVIMDESTLGSLTHGLEAGDEYLWRIFRLMLLCLHLSLRLIYFE